MSSAVASDSNLLQQQAKSRTEGFGVMVRPMEHVRLGKDAFTAVPMEMVRQLGVDHQVVVQAAPSLSSQHKSALCRPMCVTRCLQAEPIVSDADTQTTSAPPAAIFGDGRQGLLPCPVPVYAPVPVRLRAPPTPRGVPVFIPVPVPVPFPVILETPAQAAAVAAQMAAAFGPAKSAAPTTAAETAAEAVADLNLQGRDVAMATTQESAAATAVQLARKRRAAEEATQLILAASKRPRSSLAMSLKFSYGLTAWKNWSRATSAAANAATSNSASDYGSTPFDPAELDTLELADALARFVREVRKPSGEEYAADSVYYLCLGLQGHLAIDRGRDENFFCGGPVFYEFCHALDSVLDRYQARVTEDGTLVCRIEELHLWECRQLGFHSADSLLFTLFYFLTRYVGLHTAQEHAALTMGQFALVPAPASQGGGANSYALRFSPQSGYAAGMTYELTEAADPLKCPVRLFQVYLAKRPQFPSQIAGPTEPFYLLPDRRRACDPADPVWYSSEACLSEAELNRWLNRIKCVKEIQEAMMQAQMQWNVDPSAM